MSIEGRESAQVMPPFPHVINHRVVFPRVIVLVESLLSMLAGLLQWTANRGRVGW